MSDQSRKVVDLKRTRRNVLAIGGIVAGASLSRLGTKSVYACPPAVCACYLRGTHVLTPSGEQKIESLQIGDSVVTASGEAKPIDWIGRRILRRADLGWAEKNKPVRIASGALGPEIPHRDLFVSRGHCLFIDGVLISAADLVNGSSITLTSDVDYDEIEYLHIKLAAHDVIFAEGAASETMLLHANSSERYDNFDEYERLRGRGVPAEEVAYAPVVGTWGGRDRMRSRVRSALSPWHDRRTVFDMARDRLEERAEALLELS
jgi:hypothetical protein